MSTSAVLILPFNGKTASQDEYAAVNRHSNRIRREILPDDPPQPLEQTIQNLQNLPSFIRLKHWAAWDQEKTEIVAQGSVVVHEMEENKHLAQFEIEVLPEFRQQGLGRKFLRLIAEATRLENRRMLMTETVDRVPGGEAFMKRLGAKKGLESHVNQLRLADLDHGLVQDWISRGQQNLVEFELGLWDGAYPDDKIQEISELYELANQQPLGDLEIEDMHMTPERIREMEKSMFARGNQRWTFYVIDQATGKFAGYTETGWNPSRPEILSQYMTGVFPQYRNRGLGRWLKAAMLDKVLKERPQVKYVRTGNADSNAAMLKINNELGFKPYMAGTIWQVELQKVLDYLSGTER